MFFASEKNSPRTSKNPYSLKAVNKKTRAFECACTVSQEGALSPFFEGDTPL